METPISKDAIQYEFRSTGGERFVHMLWCFSTFDQYLITGHQSGHVIYWKMYCDSTKNQTRFEQCVIFQAHKQGVRCCLDLKLDSQLKSSNNLNNSQIFSPLSSFNSLLVTGSWDQSIGFWDRKGNLIHKEDQAHTARVVCLESFNGMLVSADVLGYLNVWKIEPPSIPTNLQESADAPPVTSTSLIRLSLVSSVRAHQDIITTTQPTSFGNLWTSCSERADTPCLNLKIWDSNFQELAALEQVSTNCLCEWNKKIAVACDDGTIQLYKPQGSWLFELGRHNNPVAFLCTYKQLLVSTSIKDSAIKMWTEDGECLVNLKQIQSKIALRMILVVGCRLIVAMDKSVAIWRGNIPWKVIRNLWIGWKKHKPEECGLARLPREIVLHIIVFANHS